MRKRLKPVPLQIGGGVLFGLLGITGLASIWLLILYISISAVCEFYLWRFKKILDEDRRLRQLEAEEFLLGLIEDDSPPPDTNNDQASSEPVSPKGKIRVLNMTKFRLSDLN